MAMMDWKEEYSVGVEAIDHQHKRLLNFINRLEAAIRDENEREELARLFVEMLSHAATHFATEEKYMVKFDYEDYPVHKAQHDALETKAAQLMDEYRKGDNSVAPRALLFLRDWLACHVIGSDKRYTACFQEHGLR